MEAAAPLLDKLKSEFEKVVSFLSRADWIKIAKQEKVITAERLRPNLLCQRYLPLTIKGCVRMSELPIGTVASSSRIALTFRL